MSIAVLIVVHDGLVLAADSASTLVAAASGGLVAANVYNNANKIFNLIKGQPLGCVAYGSGSIGNASIATLIKDFRKDLSAKEPTPNKYGFNVLKYTVEDVAKHLAKFLTGECEKVTATERANINAGFMVGGYSTGERVGESWGLNIAQGVIQGEPQRLRQKDEAGMNWGGQGEVIQRIVMGFGSDIFTVLGQLTQPLKTGEEMQTTLQPLLSARLQAPLIFAPMPIQDAIDLGHFLVNAAIMFSRFLPGAQVVGGPIEIAAITKHEGFKWISRKHYYEQILNKEPIHVTIDH